MGCGRPNAIDILRFIESDKTQSTCQMFNAEVCYGSGLVYDTNGCGESVVEEVEEFAFDNYLASYLMPMPCQK